ncbi:MAG: glycosyltransferase family 2 protein [Actinomycetota bacterium]
MTPSMDDSNVSAPSDATGDAEPRRRVRELEERLDRLQAEHDRVTRTLSYRLVQSLHRAFEAAVPWGTRRRSLFLTPLRGIRLIGREGWAAFVYRLVRVDRWVPSLWRPAMPPWDRLSPEERYEGWLRLVVLSPRRLRRLRRRASRFTYRPRIAIVVPVFDPEPVWLRAAIESVRKQVYANWELHIVDDGSTRADVRELLAAYAALDGRIDVITQDRNMGIAEASNAALERVTADFVGFLDHDDELKPNALYEVVLRLNDRSDLDLIYSDEDKVDVHGRLSDVFFKPDWSPDLLMSVNYLNHFTIYRTEVARRVGGFRPGFDGSQDFDLALRVSEATEGIDHIAMPLYSWRKVPGSAATHLDFKRYAFDAGTRALRAALERRGYQGTVNPGLVPGRYRVSYSIRGHPRVVIIIPTRDRVDLLQRCVDSVRQRSTYDRFEVVVVDNDSTETATLEYLAGLSERVIRYPGDFDYAGMMNFAVEELGDADFVLLLNNDTEVISGEWIEAMVEHGQRPDVAAVGGRLLLRDGRPQHEGIVVGLGGSPAQNASVDYFELGRTIRNCSAVTAACMLTRTEVFRELGGFEPRLRVAWGDVDYCLRAREKGYEIVYTPYALLYHEEGSTRGVGGLHGPEDDALFRSRWGDYRDPYYNPNFDIHRPFGIRLGG